MVDASEADRADRKVGLLVVVLLALAAIAYQRVTHLAAFAVVGHDRPWLLLAAGFALAEVCVVHVRWGREAQTFGLGEIPLVLGLFLLTPVQLVGARVLGTGLALIIFRRQSLLKVAFNLAQWLLCTSVAVLVFQATTDVTNRSGVHGWLAAVLAALCADVVGSLAILSAIRLHGRGLAIGEAWTSVWTGAMPAIANACLALVTLDVLLVDWRGGWALLVVAAFVALAQRAHVGLQKRHDGLERLDGVSAELACHLDVDAILVDVMRCAADLLEAAECELVLAPGFAGRALALRWRDGVVIRREGGAPDGLPPITPRVRGRLLMRTHVPQLTVHLTDRVTVVGSLTVSARLGEVGGFGADDLRLLRALASHATAALANGQLADQLRQQVKENEYQALHDALTGLPNRVLFDRRVTGALADGVSATVMLLDLDRFKEVNDTLGHGAGDQLLCEAGRRILRAAPTAEVVARLGGDEFALLLLGADRLVATSCAAAVREALLQPMATQGVTLSVDASVGLAMSPEHAQDTQSLLRHPDVAMYRAKSDRSGVEVYSAAYDEHTARRLSLVSELRDAIRDSELELWYQPKADLRSGGVRSVEALVRWRHPERGLVPPNDFIPVAEQTGLIDPLTHWVLNEAMRQCSTWHSQQVDLGVAVNISAPSLMKETFPSEVRTLLARHRLPPWALTLEITESAMMNDPKRASSRLHELRDLGVKVSVDDFGTGYSSLANLKHLPVDEVKIDKSFVLSLADDPRDEAIVAAIVQLVHRLGLIVVAEGVETVEIWDGLAAMGCDIAQGYLLSRPLDVVALDAWLMKQPTPPLPRQAAPLRSVPLPQ